MQREAAWRAARYRVRPLGGASDAGSRVPGEPPDSRTGASGDRLVLAARCKVNLGLAVLARRGDGFHEIETVMARLALADTLELRLDGEGAAGSVSLELVAEGAGEGDLGSAHHANAHHVETAMALPLDDDNLVVRAARLYLAQWSRATGLQAPALAVTLHKRVPVAAGLGGGSADAAATLRGLARLLPAGVELQPLAGSLGSDVPFFVADLPAALGRGRGERLTPLPPLAASLVLAKPPASVAAAEAYGALVGFTPRLRHERALTALAEGREPGWRNALQPGVMRDHQAVREVLGLLRAAGLRGCLMSGSGPACFGVAADEEEAAAVATDLAAQRPDLWVTATSLA